MSKYQRDRGAVFEREVANELQAQWGLRVKRNLGQAREGGDDLTVPPFRIECKRRQRFSAQPWMAQACAAAKPSEVPVVVVRADNQEALVVLRMSDFVRLGREEAVAHATTEMLA